MINISKNFKIICLCIFFTNVLISHFLLPLYKNPDRYPFFDWNLFSEIPSVFPKIFIKVVKTNEINLPPDEWVFKNRKKYYGKDFYNVPDQIERFGNTLIASPNNTQEIDRLRQELEENLFSNFRSVEYELVYVKIDLKKVLITKKIKNYKSLGIFQYKHDEN